MKRFLSLFLLSALLGAGPASAMRAPGFIDADQRGHVTLPGDRPLPAISVAQGPDVASAAEEMTLPTPEQARRDANAAPPVVSPVPEPSGLAMLACGMVLLLLAPYGRDDEDSIAPEYVKHPGSSL